MSERLSFGPEEPAGENPKKPTGQWPKEPMGRSLKKPQELKEFAKNFEALSSFLDVDAELIDVIEGGAEDIKINFEGVDITPQGVLIPEKLKPLLFSSGGLAVPLMASGAFSHYGDGSKEIDMQIALMDDAATALRIVGGDRENSELYKILVQNQVVGSLTNQELTRLISSLHPFAENISHQTLRAVGELQLTNQQLGNTLVTIGEAFGLVERSHSIYAHLGEPELNIAKITNNTPSTRPCIIKTGEVTLKTIDWSTGNSQELTIARHHEHVIDSTRSVHTVWVGKFTNVYINGAIGPSYVINKTRFNPSCFEIRNYDDLLKNIVTKTYPPIGQVISLFEDTLHRTIGASKSLIG
jgi:hypothetical protein